jgi:hypothetical protein
MDTYEGSNHVPLSLHKYLYVHGNPVNGIDPTGFIRMIPSSLTLGKLVEIEIEAKFRMDHGNGNIFLDKSIRGILEKIVPYQGVGRLRPDIVDFGAREVYDIKSFGEYAEGIGKVQYYVEMLNLLDPSVNAATQWMAGLTWHMSPQVFMLTPKIAVSVAPTSFGVIPYQLFEIEGPKDLVYVSIYSSVPSTRNESSMDYIALQYATAVTGAAYASRYAARLVPLIISMVNHQMYARLVF